MIYKMIQRRNPQKPDEPKRWCAMRANIGKKTLKDIADDIVIASALSEGDVDSMITSLLNSVPTHLLSGHIVSLGRLGTFRLSFSSKGAETKEDFSTRMISGIRIVYRPSAEILEMVSKPGFVRQQ